MTNLRSLLFKTVGFGLAAWAAGTGLLGTSARADIITFNPDGAGPSPALQIAGYDFAVGNVLAADSITAIQNFIANRMDNGTRPETFRVYYQANLGGLVLDTDRTVQPDGLNNPRGTPFEITAVASLLERVTNVRVTPGAPTGTIVAEFTTAANQGPVATIEAGGFDTSFVQFFFDSTPDANSLAGTGFTDGTRILAGAPIPSDGTGSFTINTNAVGLPITELFDQNTPDNYMGKQTVVGSGVTTTRFAVDPTSLNPAFFPTGSTPVLSFVTDNNSRFTNIDPSMLFSRFNGAAFFPVVPDLGNVNGSNNPAVGGTPTAMDFQFRSDATVANVPEPASMTLLGMGLAGAFGYGWRKRKQSA